MGLACARRGGRAEVRRNASPHFRPSSTPRPSARARDDSVRARMAADGGGADPLVAVQESATASLQAIFHEIRACEREILARQAESRREFDRSADLFRARVEMFQKMKAEIENSKKAVVQRLRASTAAPGSDEERALWSELAEVRVPPPPSPPPSSLPSVAPHPRRALEPLFPVGAASRRRTTRWRRSSGSWTRRSSGSTSRRRRGSASPSAATPCSRG